MKIIELKTDSVSVGRVLGIVLTKGQIGGIIALG